MEKRAILLDFTSLLDITMLILFFFVLFSHVETENERAALQEKQEQVQEILGEAEQRLEEADEKVNAAKEKEAFAEEKLEEAELAEERAGQNVDGIAEFSRNTNIRVHLQMMEEGNWSIMLYQGNEFFLEIAKNSAQNMADAFSDGINAAGYDIEDTLLCEFVFNGTEFGTNSAYHVVDNMFALLKDEYRHFFYSTIDLSVLEGSDL